METKYNPGDWVWAMEDGGIFYGVVTRVMIEVGRDPLYEVTYIAGDGYRESLECDFGHLVPGGTMLTAESEIQALRKMVCETGRVCQLVDHFSSRFGTSPHPKTRTFQELASLLPQNNE